ncbi:MAG TPA: SIS domain-containing protein [Solirubrobacteraceae bacterium]|jgi:D-sedoheptulose 7-phosphate isomerase|nr:SIS domain-containing protein [Solirubrobacteraceae bacterium]
MTESFAAQYLAEAAEIAGALPAETIDRMAAGIAQTRERGGRLFILGIGGGAGHASHAVNDFRKLCHIETYTPTDNVSELTARTNDDGWETTFTEWLKTSRLSDKDALLVFSVGGGSLDPPISVNLAKAVELASERGANVYGIVGRATGITAQLATECVVVPAPANHFTPHVEAFQAVVWHLLVTHPALAAQAGKWETSGAL